MTAYIQQGFKCMPWFEDSIQENITTLLLRWGYNYALFRTYVSLYYSSLYPFTGQWYLSRFRLLCGYRRMDFIILLRLWNTHRNRCVPNTGERNRNSHGWYFRFFFSFFLYVTSLIPLPRHPVKRSVQWLLVVSPADKEAPTLALNGFWFVILYCSVVFYVIMILVSMIQWLGSQQFLSADFMQNFVTQVLS